MPNIDILILAIIRGVSEILPIDSAAHIALAGHLYCWQEQGQSMIAAASAGALAALLLYFIGDVFDMARSMLRVLRGKRDPGAAIVLFLFGGSVPALLVMFVVRYFLDFTISDPIYIGALLVAFAVVLYVADQTGLTVRRMEQMNFAQASIIGLFQVLALLPGVGRIGVAITVGRMLGYERIDSARFALLLSIPWLLASTLYHGYLGVSAGEAPELQSLVLMASVTAIAAFFAIVFLMYWLRQGTLTLFVIYRAVFGGVMIYALYGLPGLFCW